MSLSDELETNPFYNFVLNKQHYLQEVLSNGCILCIPVTTTLSTGTPSEAFVDLHILRPSPLYKWEYSTLWRKANNQPVNVTWNQKENSLTADHTESLNILYSEKAYIQKVKYTVLLIERPLHPIHNDAAANRQTPLQQSKETTERIPIENTSLHDIENYLKLDKRIKSSAVLKEIQLFKSKYIVLPQFLNDAAKKLESIASKYSKPRSSNHSKQILISFIHHHTFEHVYRLVRESSDSSSLLYHQQCHYIQGDNIKLSEFSTPDVRLRLSELESATSPLQIISLLKLTLDEICESTEDPNGQDDRMSSDELIPVLIDVMVQNDQLELPSLLLYVQIFGKDIMGFHEAFEFTLATYRAAVQYITDFSLEQYTDTNDGLPRIRSTSQDTQSTAGPISKDLDAGSFLSEYVKPYANTRPFDYHSQGDSQPLDRYAILACLSS